MNLTKIKEFNIKGTPQELIPIQNGYINASFSLICQEENQKIVYFLQKVNTSIFQNPDQIGQNIAYVNQILKKNDYKYLPLELISHQNGNFGHWIEDEYWRLFTHIDTAYSIDKIENPTQAYNAAKAYSHFSRCLAGADPKRINAGIPTFFDFQARIQAFEAAIQQDVKQRVRYCKTEINWIREHFFWIYDFSNLKLPKRLIHADPKIGNLLFDQNTQQVKAVIDWDTIMESSILMDFGDMVRSMCCLSTEDEANPKNVKFSIENLDAIQNGFMEEWASYLTPVEETNIILAAKVIILVQAIRFLTDFIQGDIYYATKHEIQNYLRAYNQIILAKALEKYK